MLNDTLDICHSLMSATDMARLYDDALPTEPGVILFTHKNEINNPSGSAMRGRIF